MRPRGVKTSLKFRRGASGASALRLATPVMALALGLGVAIPTADAETISGALAKAYAYSPDLGQQRAAGRAADEGVARAASALRPTVAATATGGYSNNRLESRSGIFGPSTTKSITYPRTAGVTVTQTIFNGGRTVNSIRQAESSALQGREQVRLAEINVLNNAATAYMNVLRDSALYALNQSNVRVLEEQLRQSRSRFEFGEITRTDVAQAEAALSQGQANRSTAEGNLQNSLAVYRQLIGEEPPNLSPARPLDAMLPRTVEEAIDYATVQHPQIQAALHAVDAAALAVKVQEGALYPTVSVQGSVAQNWDVQGTPKQNIWQYSAIGSLNVPLYDGGLSYATIRQAKEQLSQARLQADLQRENIRAAVVSAWAGLRSSRANIRSYQAQIRANEVALAGVREEAKLGQRTTLDVLNAQQTLLNSRVSLVGAQRDQVVQSYGLLAAMGKLSAAELGLKVQAYDPSVHFNQVADKKWGLRTPDGQ